MHINVIMACLGLTIDQSSFKNVLSFVCHTGGGGASKSMQKDEYFKLCTVVVQELIALSFVLLLDGPQVFLTMRYNVLKTGLVYTFSQGLAEQHY